MKKKILIVEVSNTIYTQQKDSWSKAGFTFSNAKTMQEAIKMITEDRFVIVVINADEVNYLSMLPVMRAATAEPIFVRTSKYSLDDETTALKAGADSYRETPPDTEGSAKRGLAIFERFASHFTVNKPTLKFITHGNVSIFPAYRMAFVKETAVNLTKKEYEVLIYLLSNPKRVYNYNQIIRRVWGDEYTDNGNNVLLNVIKRLRKKINVLSDKEYIVNVHEVGYAFDRYIDK